MPQNEVPLNIWRSERIKTRKSWKRGQPTRRKKKKRRKLTTIGDRVSRCCSRLSGSSLWNQRTSAAWRVNTVRLTPIRQLLRARAPIIGRTSAFQRRLPISPLARPGFSGNWAVPRAVLSIFRVNYGQPFARTTGSPRYTAAEINEIAKRDCDERE